MRALILCAGNGTRLGLKNKPKCMAIVKGKPVLEHLVNHLNKQGITEIIINIHKNYQPIFDYFGSRVLYFYEPTLMGEYATEQLLMKWLGSSYVVMNGDTLTNIDITKLRSIHMQARSPITRFMKKGRYAGTSIKTNEGPPFMISYNEWDGDGAYYFDIGTPAKLEKARRYFKNHVK